MRMVSGYAQKVIRKGTQYNRPPEADIIYQFARELGMKISCLVPLEYLVDGKLGIIILILMRSSPDMDQIRLCSKMISYLCEASDEQGDTEEA